MKKILFLCCLAFTGCETLQSLNPFDRPPDPLKGERKEVQLKNLEYDRSIPQPFNPADAEKPPVEAPIAKTEKKKK
jgi:hypothetical protein